MAFFGKKKKKKKPKPEDIPLGTGTASGAKQIIIDKKKELEDMLKDIG